MDAIEPAVYLAATRRWFTRAVLGLNLCPFAGGPWAAGTVHLALTEASDTESLLQSLSVELEALVAMPDNERETTLLIHPHVLGDFLEFVDFLEIADALLEELELDGIVQVASFHPGYQFADSAPDDVANCTNRSPYPILHLLRESSVTRAVEATDTDAISERNVQVLRELGWPGWNLLWREQ